MANFYNQYLRQLFDEMRNDNTAFKSHFWKRRSRKQKTIYYHEAFVSWLTRKISRNKFGSIIFSKNSFFQKNIELFENLFNDLNDDYSKEKFINYSIYKSFNSSRYGLNFNQNEFKKSIEKIETLRLSSERSNFTNLGDLSLYDLSSLGYNLKLINTAHGIAIDFVLEQYAYKDFLSAEKNDIVIDCGGAIGDTALYFTSKGAEKVYIFEFIKSNIDLIKKQIENNPHLKDNVVIVEKPVWNKSDTELSYVDKGNSSKVAGKDIYPNKIRTLSIDDLVKANNIEKIDFIKMDIEGAELQGLKGAEEVIRKFKPKLAISVYHKDDDLIKIPEYIKQLNPNYHFYFDYYTDIGWEAVLYAIDNAQ